jgi:integrase/recombinase XerD
MTERSDIMIDNVITAVLAQIDDMPVEALQRVQKAMVIVLSDYQINRKSTELVRYTGNPELLKLFLASKRVEGAKDRTIKSYREILSRYLARLQKDPLTTTTNDIRLYLAIREGEGLKKSTLATLLCTLKSFYQWLENEEYIVKSPARKIKSIKADKRTRKPIEADDLEKMRIACRTLRERAMFELFLSTGARLQEIVQLNRDDINWKNDCCYVFGKGSKERKVFLNAKARVHLQAYLDSTTDENSALFVASKGAHARLGRRSVEIDFHNIGARANVNLPVFPHRIRHTFATSTLKAGASLEEVQLMLGHENPATTTIYAQLASEDVQAAHRKCAAA